MRLYIIVVIALFAFMSPSNAKADYPYDCFGLDVPSASSCGLVSTAGCCDAAGRTVWCDAGQLYCINCAAQEQTCGWSATYEFYDCDQVGEDPSGWEPYDCAGGCTPNCSGRTCGTDGCGGSCGTCADGQFCISGSCYNTPPVCNGSSVPIGSECGDVNYIGCCDSTGKTIWCSGAALYCVDCVGVGNPNCGWDAANSGYNCGTTGTEDPSGLYPLSCGPPPCVPDCYGKQCGDNGCGGSCGTCGAQFTCNASSQCEPVICTPSCSGKYCGPNGCGGTCGECAATEACSATGQCEPTVCDPTCAGRQCGSDGCGGSCGLCNPDSQCLAGLCVCNLPCGGSCCAAGAICYNSTCCTPMCTDMECGDNGCGGSCGTCTGDNVCNDDGICEAPPCEPSCGDDECGDDGCGGSCGACADYSVCVSGQCLCEFNCAGNCCPPNAKCVAGTCCIPSCDGKECGSDGCNGTCGTCPGSETCLADGTCQECQTDCADKECGSDGCNGSCGSCQPGETCTNGICLPPGQPDQTPDVVTPDVTAPDTTTEDLTEDLGTPDVAAPDQSHKDHSAPDLNSVDQESDQGGGLIIPAEDLASHTTTKTVGCSAQPTPTTSPLALSLLLLSLACAIMRKRG